MIPNWNRLFLLIILALLVSSSCSGVGCTASSVSAGGADVVVGGGALGAGCVPWACA